MIWLPVLLAGGVLYAGSKALPSFDQSAKTWFGRKRAKACATDSAQAERELAVSAVSLGVAAAGSLLKLPVLGWLSVPVTVYLLAPVMREAGQVVVQERRVNDQVLTSARLAVCMTMSYTFIAALDASLHVVTHWLRVRNAERWQQALQQHLGSQAQPWLQHWDTLAEQPTHWQRVGERSGAIAAPLMLVTCVLATPALGINRSSAFLTTFFGAHVRKLGPYTTQETLHQALDRGLLLTHPQVLEQAVNMDTVVFDGRLLHDTWVDGQFAASVQALQQQARRVYVFTEADDALCALAGVDACFNAVTADERVAWIQQWQATGKQVCYVGSGLGNSAECQAANLSVVAQAVLPTTLPAAEDLPDAFLLGTDLQAVPHLFTLSAAFGKSQRFNLIAPMGVDVVDISTTLLLDFGLVYSVMFTYVGLLVGMGRTHWRESQALPANTQSLPASLPA